MAVNMDDGVWWFCYCTKLCTTYWASGPLWTPGLL